MKPPKTLHDYERLLAYNYKLSIRETRHLMFLYQSLLKEKNDEIGALTRELWMLKH